MRINSPAPPALSNLTFKRRTPGYSGKSFPDGSFTVGWDSANFNTEKRRSQQYERLRGEQEYHLCDETGTPWLTVPLDAAVECGWRDAVEQESRLSLGLSSLCNSHKTPRRGLKGITSLGRRTVRSGAVLLEKEFGKKRLGLLTVTVPPLGEICERLLNFYWAELVRRFVQEVGREYERRTGKGFEYVNCTEIQERRYQRTGSLGLHLHLLYPCRGLKGGFYLSANFFRTLLRRTILAVLTKALSDCSLEGTPLPEVDTSAAVDCQVVRKSAAGYLGKYLSKGGKILSAVARTPDADSLPAQWWGISSSLRKRVRSATKKLSPEFCDWLVNRTADAIFQGVVRTARHVTLLVRGKPSPANPEPNSESVFLLGVTGFFCPDWFEENLA